MKAFLSLTLLVFAATSLPARSEETLRQLIEANPLCRQFNDGCSICRIDGGQTTCSSPALVCKVSKWKCAESNAATGQTDQSDQQQTVTLPDNG
jgi:hypothetical protein